jgi:hypothetical protein
MCVAAEQLLPELYSSKNNNNNNNNNNNGKCMRKIMRFCAPVAVVEMMRQTEKEKEHCNSR